MLDTTGVIGKYAHRMKSVGAKMGKKPQVKIKVSPGWWDRLVNYCQKTNIAKTPDVIYDRTKVSRRTFFNAKKTNNFTEFILDSIVMNLGCENRDKLLEILGGQVVGAKTILAEGSTTTPDIPKKEPELKLLHRRILASAINAIDMVDQLADPISVFIRNRPVASAPYGHRCKIEGDSQKMVVTIEGRECQRITADDLKNLSASDCDHIKTLEQSMQRHYQLWQNIYPERGSSSDKRKNNETDERISRLILNMAQDLFGIITFVEALGLYLDDHYMHIRHLIASYGDQQSSKTSRKGSSENPTG